MRKGTNPEKENFDILIKNYHRIIIPIYIPHFEGYFSDSFEILKLCIQSLLLTVHDKTRITLYNNGSHPLVKEYIDELYQKEGYIDQVFHSKENLGKINAYLSAAKSNVAPLITVTDADVFFKNNWQSSVEKIFIDFKEAGMVSPVPSSKAFKNFVNANWYYGFFKGKIRFKDVADPEGLKNFDVSLGNAKPLYDAIHLKQYMVLSNKKNEAVMGCGHFLATLRREVFDKGPNEPSYIKIHGGIENKFIDFPNEELGFLRLATKKNYAYHLGNTVEDWMYKELESMPNIQEKSLKSQDFMEYKKLNKRQLFVGKLFCKLLLAPFCRGWYLKKIGLRSDKPLDY